MTLAVGDYVVKMKDGRAMTPQDGEAHILFEVMTEPVYVGEGPGAMYNLRLRSADPPLVVELPPTPLYTEG